MNKHLTASEMALNLYSDSNVNLTNYQKDYLAYFTARYKNWEKMDHLNPDQCADVLNQLESEFHFWRLKQVFSLKDIV